MSVPRPRAVDRGNGWRTDMLRTHRSARPTPPHRAPTSPVPLEDETTGAQPRQERRRRATQEPHLPRVEGEHGGMPEHAIEHLARDRGGQRPRVDDHERHGRHTGEPLSHGRTGHGVTQVVPRDVNRVGHPHRRRSEPSETNLGLTADRGDEGALGIRFDKADAQSGVRTRHPRKQLDDPLGGQRSPDHRPQRPGADVPEQRPPQPEPGRRRQDVEATTGLGPRRAREDVTAALRQGRHGHHEVGDDAADEDQPGQLRDPSSGRRAEGRRTHNDPRSPSSPAASSAS
jgi:hypothetical protein